MDIAIEVQKISLGEDKLLFKPVRLLKGIYDEEKDIFIDEFENKYSNMNGNNPYDEKYFSSKCILEDLRQTYFNLQDDTKILGQFLEDSINIFYVGYYDGITGTIKTLEYSFADIEAEISSKEYGLDFSNVKEEVIGFDLTENQRFVFDINSLNELKKIKSIDQLETFIDELISTGEYIKNEINSNNSKEIVSADKFECNENNSVDAQQEIDIDFVWEKVTPYTILRIEEKDYSKEELLKKVRVLIDDIKKIYSDEILIKKQIDIILDAYNEIINVNNKNSKTKMKKSR